MEFPKLFLKPKREQSLHRFHPWVFSGAIDRAEGRLIEGDLVEVCDHRGGFLALAQLSGGSIAARVISFEQRIPDQVFWIEKFHSAFELRKKLGLSENSNTTMYRLIHGEGDGLPGLIVDVYGQTAVMQCHSLGMYLIRQQLAEAMVTVTGGMINSVYDKSAETLGKHDLPDVENAYLIGNAEDATTEALEYGMKFRIDWVNGQKTGFFIDQRENRKLLGELSAGKSVLNTFCYTGGFSVSALKEGAAEVHSLDSSAPALELTTENVALNFGKDKRHQVIRADAVEYLSQLERSYDIIVLDPPAFAKHLSARHNAVQGYKRINYHGLKRVSPGGFLFTFSCSQAVDTLMFRNTVTAAAIEAGRKVRVVHQLHQPADHPVNIFHPEGEYLKGLVLFVE